MNRRLLWNVLRGGALLCSAFFVTTAVAQSANVLAQRVKPVISLDPSEPLNAASLVPVQGEASFTNAPANFHSFPSAAVGEDTYAERLTLRFRESTKLTRIESTKDFQVDQGSSCAEGRFYSEGETCILLVHFTPQGPGRRFGKLTITHTASPEVFSIGLGGSGYAPVVSFTPGLMTTVPGTYPSNAGLLSGAKNLTVDGGDTLYVADTGNNLIRSLDSSGTIRTLASGYTAPLGIAVDNFGEVYFDQPAANKMYEIYDYGPVVQVSGTGTASCPASTPCVLSSEALGTPGMMSMDAYNHLFFVDSHQGAAFATVQPLPAKLVFLYDPFSYQTNPSSAIATDASDNIYSQWSNGGECEIVRGTLYDAENSNVIFTKITGGHTCGFSGDGGQAANAEMGATVGQMAFDLAGNFYFSDTANQRVRRVDSATGIIRTIAGNGTAGYAGDYVAATSAQLSSPTGLGVDSQGQVYIISGAAATGTPQVIRKVGPNGYLAFGGQLVGTNSSAQLMTVSNTGNSALTITNAVLTGTNPTDFAIDPNTTSCLLTPGSTLYSGQTCKIDILFKPSAGGYRYANLVLLDNTVTNSNTVQLVGTATLHAPTITITSPATGTSVPAGTAITFSVTVTSTVTPAPTGTVKFLADGAAIGSPVTLSSSGAASVSLALTTVGTHTLSATYNGNTFYPAAGPVTRTYTVTAAPSMTTLASVANPAARCKPVDFTVTVTGARGTEPTGKVVLKKGAVVLATAALSDATATLSTSALPVGTNMLTASYEGDATNDASISPVFRQVIMSSRVGCSSVGPRPDPLLQFPRVPLAP